MVESGYSTFLLADEAVALSERHDGSRPFFLYLPFNAVHNPNDAPDEYIEPYAHLDYPKQLGQFKAMDVAIGRVMDALERKGVLDDTLILFLNDNGGTQEAGWNPPYRGKKSGFYEGGIRVPAVLRWPGQIPAGSESDAPLHVVDLFPTFAGSGRSGHRGRPAARWTGCLGGAHRRGCRKSAQRGRVCARRDSRAMGKRGRKSLTTRRLSSERRKMRSSAPRPEGP